MHRCLRIVLPAVALAVTLAACGAGAGESLRSTATATAATSPSGVHLVKIANFDAPLYVTGAPGDASRVFIVLRTGQIRVIRGGHVQGAPFLDLSGTVYTQGGGEQGLLGLAFAPDYKRTGVFYVDYTVPGNDIEVVQYKRSAADAGVADPKSARRVIAIDHHSFANHNGGQLAFGPDHDLYIGVGDGGSEGDPEENGQNTDTLLGKILRITPLPGGGYSIPADNPFAGQEGHRPEIWAYGLRNPWRFSFDRLTGDMIIGDVGQDSEEEIDFAPAGTGAAANYGWSFREGNRRNKSGVALHAVSPVLVASHAKGYCAIIGGYVVRDRSLGGLYGHYLFGDYCHPGLESVMLSKGRATGLRDTGLEVKGTSSLGQDSRGHLYVTSIEGPVYRIVGGSN